MDSIVKAGAVLTVQFQRDVTLKRENVLMDARLDGNFRHVPSFLKNISIDKSHLILVSI